MSLLNIYMEFDVLVREILEEAGGRCTKVTGQQSSTRKDKKYLTALRINASKKDEETFSKIYEQLIHQYGN